MVKPVYKDNARHIQADLLWLEEVVKRRYHSQRSLAGEDDFKMPHAPSLDGKSIYKGIIEKFKFTVAERVVVLLALLPQLSPYYFEIIWSKISGKTDPVVKSFAKPGAYHTIDLALYLLAGDDLEKRFLYQRLFEEDSFLIRHRIIILDEETGYSQAMNHIKISPDYLQLLTDGTTYKPRFSTSFPAKHIQTDLDWDELILNPHVKNQVEEIKSWIKYGNILLNEWQLSKRLAPGYKILFYGPPGTGKTLTASMLGKEAGVDVFRIDLSMVVSKYIGETEKNLSRIFDEADKRDWILFFDEADALFGKRTETKDSHDRYANQEVAFLLQKIEDHNGVVILSSNMKSNIDEAFNRRFQSIIYFAIPTAEERLTIWENGFSTKTSLEKGISLKQIATKFEMSGGAIMNVVRYASLKAMERRKNIIELKDLMNGINREFAKEGRTI